MMEPDQGYRFLGDEIMADMTTKNKATDMLSSSSSSSSIQLVHVSTPLLLLTAAPLLIVIYISAQMEMSLERPVVVGIIRTFVQLSILGLILEPIFVWGETNPWLVVGYTCLMILLAAYESMHRSRYQFPGMFVAVLTSLGINVLWVSLFAFGGVLRPDPVWDPQYVIPIVGMLLGNCINGISLALNNMLTALVEQAREIELYLSFGANPQEATMRLMREAVRVGAMPQLNSMAIIGIISIPGMMTGQILGGSPVQEAARYQMLIMYLIAMCAFFTILTEVTMALRAGFDSSARLRTDYFIDKKKVNSTTTTTTNSMNGLCMSTLRYFWRGCCCCCYCCYHWCFSQDDDADDAENDLIPVSINGKHDTETTGLLSSDAPLNNSKIEFRKVRTTSEGRCRLEVSNLTHSFVVPEEENDEIIMEGNLLQDGATSKNNIALAATTPTKSRRRRRILFENVSLELKSGEIVVVSGISGAGKSTFLRLVAGLEPIVGTRRHPSGYIQLNVPPTITNGSPPQRYDSQHDRSLWRRQVRYVTQIKVDLPGTPRQFIRRISSLRVSKNKQLPPSLNPPSTTMIMEVRELVQVWGMDSSSLESEWSTLSGGEAQRMIVAIALASRPRVLLLDESTAALDLKSKLLVEKTVVEYCQAFEMSVLWITHDPEQMERLASMTSP